MPETTPELAWWIMTGVIAGLLSLITVMVGVLAYVGKSGMEKIISLLDKLSTAFNELKVKEAATEQRVALMERQVNEQAATCKRRHEHVLRTEGA